MLIWLLKIGALFCISITFSYGKNLSYFLSNRDVLFDEKGVKIQYGHGNYEKWGDKKLETVKGVDKKYLLEVKKENGKVVSAQEFKYEGDYSGHHNYSLNYVDVDKNYAMKSYTKCTGWIKYGIKISRNIFCDTITPPLCKNILGKYPKLDDFLKQERKCTDFIKQNEEYTRQIRKDLKESNFQKISKENTKVLGKFFTKANRSIIPRFGLKRRTGTEVLNTLETLLGTYYPVAKESRRPVVFDHIESMIKLCNKLRDFFPQGKEVKNTKRYFGRKSLGQGK